MTGTPVHVNQITLSKKVNDAHMGLRLYYFFLSFTNCFTAGFIVLISFPFFGSEMTTKTGEPITSEQRVFALFLLCIALLIMFGVMALNLYMVYAIKKQSSFIYYYTFATSIIGIGSLITMVPAVLVLILMLDKEVREYYLGK